MQYSSVAVHGVCERDAPISSMFIVKVEVVITDCIAA